jgi:hypothetical protein
MNKDVAANSESSLAITPMTLQERSDLVLAFACVLHVNGQSTDETLAASGRLGDSLGLRAHACSYQQKQSDNSGWCAQGHRQLRLPI